MASPTAITAGILKGKGKRRGGQAASNGHAVRAVVQILLATGKSYTIETLREKLREFFVEDNDYEKRAVAGAGGDAVAWWRGPAAELAVGRPPHARVTRAGVAWHHRGRARRDRHQRGELIEWRGEGLPSVRADAVVPVAAVAA